MEQLLALNGEYIEAVQQSDVKRFEEMLGADFLCSNPDGSLVDKSAFLIQVGRPPTITGLTADDVHVRLLGDVAIVHGRTSYYTAARELKHGRYTDVWQRRNGTWVAVSAHVTR